MTHAWSRTNPRSGGMSARRRDVRDRAVQCRVDVAEHVLLAGCAPFWGGLLTEGTWRSHMQPRRLTQPSEGRFLFDQTMGVARPRAHPHSNSDPICIVIWSECAHVWCSPLFV